MKLKHHGSQEELTALLRGIGVTGQWIDGDPKEFHMNGGGKVRWWTTTHTVFVQGSPIIALDITTRLSEAIAAKETCTSCSSDAQAPTSLDVKQTSDCRDPTPVRRPQKRSAAAKFFGRPNELKTRIAATKIPGTWTFEAGAHTFHARTGAVLKWYPKSGSLSFQGPFGPRNDFRKPALIALNWPAQPASQSRPALEPVQQHEQKISKQSIAEGADD